MTQVHRAEMLATGFRALAEVGAEILGPDRVHEIVRELGLTPEELSDPNAWFSLRSAEQFIERLEHETQDPRFLAKVGRLILSPKHLGPIYPLVKAFGTPAFTYTQMAAIARRVNRVGAFQVTTPGPGKIILRYETVDGAPPENGSFMCRCRIAQFEAVPVLFDLPQAQVGHPECMQRRDPACIYEIEWEERPKSVTSLSGGAGGAIAGAGLGWLWGLGFAPAGALCVGLAMAGWGLGRVWELKTELGGRIADLQDHRDALTTSAESNERRFTELLEAKAVLDRKVEERTRELQETSRRLAQTLDRVQALDRAKTEFFNNVSHELRTPLTLILGPLRELVEGRVDPAETSMVLDTMQRNANRLLRLINQTLDLAKIDAGQMHIQPAELEVGALAAEVTANFEAAARGRHIEIGLDTPAALVACWDRSWIESAIVNLLANALRHVNDGGHVHIRVGERGADVEVEVTDSGPGMERHELSRIFDRFAQASTSDSGGTGLGLAIVREAARLHGGTASVRSEPGQGTTFTLILPRMIASTGEAVPLGKPRLAARRDQPLPEVPRSEAVRQNDSSGLPDGPLAIVVEDHVELRDYTARVLSERYRVMTASDGVEALELLEQHTPDVVISDVAMPGMSGYELCRRLRDIERTRSVPIILVTAAGDLPKVLEGFEAGANDYVTKPYHARELLARVDVHVKLQGALREIVRRERLALLGTVAASVAHQVRNPLTTLVSGLPAMRRRIGDRLDAASLEMLETMLECAGRIQRTTNDLLDLSRIDREKHTVFEPGAGLMAAVRLMTTRVGSSNVKIAVDIDERSSLSGRPGDLNQVFMNLLDNAVREVGAEGTIRVTGAVDEGSYLARVEDSGRGVEPEEAKRIFEPFWTTRGPGEGTGLGLSVALEVVRDHGGTIEVGRSELGGAAFSVRLPLARQAATGSGETAVADVRRSVGA